VEATLELTLNSLAVIGLGAVEGSPAWLREFLGTAQRSRQAVER
jgi:hypothetical protein